MREHRKHTVQQREAGGARRWGENSRVQSEVERERDCRASGSAVDSLKRARAKGEKMKRLRLSVRSAAGPVSCTGAVGADRSSKTVWRPSHCDGARQQQASQPAKQGQARRWTFTHQHSHRATRHGSRHTSTTFACSMHWSFSSQLGEAAVQAQMALHRRRHCLSPHC